MTTSVWGIHHVTALAGKPPANLAFYQDLLGLRLVKRTVNFDDPFTHHLYYGDDIGRPGTLLTYFPHPRARGGRRGTREIRTTVLAVPSDALGSWRARLDEHGVRYRDEESDHVEHLAFADPAGMELALEPTAGDAAGDAIAGVDRVVIHVPDAEATARFLADTMGFERGQRRNERERLFLGADRRGARLDLVDAPSDAESVMGAGTVHHVAWRVPDDQAQAEAGARLRAAGAHVTPVMDRQYFRSIYFRIPGGVIFEIATDGPGFDVDEPAAKLGRALQLPPQYEPRRAEIESKLAPLTA